MRQDVAEGLVGKVSNLLQRYILVWLVLLSLVAMLAPRWISPTQDPFLASRPYLWQLIGVTMFAIGWMLPLDEVAQLARRWPLVLFGTAVQFITMPLAAWLVATLVGFEGDTLVGVIIVGCVPGAMASNVLTLAARGNVSYSVSLTTSATLLSPLLVPWTLWLLVGQTVTVPAGTIMFQLFAWIVVPVVAGHLCGRALPKLASTVHQLGSIVAHLTILWIIAVVVAQNRDAIGGLARDVPTSSWLVGGLLAVNLIGYLSGYGAGVAVGIPEPMRRALTLEIGMQNAGLGATLASKFFAPEAAIPCALFTFGCMFTGTVLARWWAARPPHNGNVPLPGERVSDKIK